MNKAQALWRDIEAIRGRSPLVHNITNFVVMNSTANALLALGASPIMAHAPEELDDLVPLAGAMVINIGTLSAPWIQSMVRGGRLARDRSIPVILDPVGAGASKLRTDTAIRIMEEVRPAVVRGNASEILSLAGQSGATKGVDSTRASHEAGAAAEDLAGRYGCCVVVSGAEDVVAGAGRVATVRGGHELMPRVTGMGCTATAVIGAFAAVNPVPVEAAAMGMAAMAVAGGMAAEKAQGPGSMQMHFIDALYGLVPQDVEDRVDIEWR